MSAQLRDRGTPSVASAHASSRWPWIFVGLLLLGVGAGLFAWLTFAGGEEEAQSRHQPPLVRVAMIERADSLEVRQTGFVRPLFEVDVATEVGGRIAELGPDFRLGARINAGDVLLRLEMDTFEAELEQALAQLEQARSAVTEARITRDRADDLEDRGFATEERLQEAILGLARSQADLASARAGISRARNNLTDATITAPFDGLVTARSAAPGQIVQPGAGVGTLVALEAGEVEMGLVARDIALLGDLNELIGAKVEVRGLGPDAAELASGVVSDIDPRIEERTRTTALVVRIDDPFSPRDPRPLRVNELVELLLPARIAEDTVLSVPASALSDRDAVWTVEDATLRRVHVEVLHRTEDRAFILAGPLEAGAQVMVSTMAAAFEGQAVRVAEPQGEGGS